MVPRNAGRVWVVLGRVFVIAPTAPMSSPRLHVFPWDQPLVYAAVAWLTEGWGGDGPLDLADTLIVVPTRQAGRRLREGLAAHAATRGQAVFPPRVVQPEMLATFDARPAGEGLRTASRVEAQLAWCAVLAKVDLDEFRAVFPHDPPLRNFAWAARLAREFQRLQATLVENGLRMADVSRRMGDGFPEAERWRQLGELEGRCDAGLAGRGLRTSQAANIAASVSPEVPAGVRRVAMIGTPDPWPLALRVLEAWAAHVPVTVTVAGPADESPERWADAWGRPLPEVWARRELRLADFEKRVRLCADPAGQAERVVEVARAYGERAAEVLAVGVADAEVLPALESGLSRAGVAAFNPEGRAMRGGALHTLLASLAEAVREPTFGAVAALLRCPDLLEWVEERGGLRRTDVLRQLDALHEEHLPASLDAARVHAAAGGEPFGAVSTALVAVAGLLERTKRGGFPEGVRTALAEIFERRKFDLEHPEDAAVVEAATAWGEVTADVATAVARFPGTTAQDAWTLALQALGERMVFDEKPTDGIDLQGWLELAWEDAPHLILTGVNDGRVPDAVVGDAYLPEQLRGWLGLKSNEQRFARDAYLFSVLAAQRSGGGAGRGRLEVLLGKTSAGGDPLKPSRLLMRCADAELPARVKFLFGAAPEPKPGAAWRRAWRLVPRTDAKIERMRVTAFRDYLKCPFRFYLRHGLRMEAVEPQKAELDAADFGNLCHAALDAMGREPGLRDCTDERVLRDYLLGKLDDVARARYGSAQSLPLVVQLESARQRLSRTATVQARERAEGWVIEHTEKEFEFALHGLTVRGKIDRIDRHEGDGRVRVLDYKTSDKPVNPLDAHVRRLKRSETRESVPAYSLFNTPDGERVWTDLQLPLYLRAVSEEFGYAVACGYFNLPKAAGETAVATWADYDDRWQAEAERCAEGVAEAVAARRFWPPAELEPDWDDFAELFTRGAAESVEWVAPAGVPGPTDAVGGAKDQAADVTADERSAR